MENLEPIFKMAAKSCGACVCGADATSQTCPCQGSTLPFGTGDGDGPAIRGHDAMGQYRGW